MKIAILMAMVAALAIIAVNTCAAQGQHTGPGAWIPANPAYVTAEGQRVTRARDLLGGAKPSAA